MECLYVHLVADAHIQTGIWGVCTLDVTLEARVYCYTGCIPPVLQHRKNGKNMPSGSASSLQHRQKKQNPLR